jgi:hypothetical protein
MRLVAAPDGTGGNACSTLGGLSHAVLVYLYG